MLGAQDEGVGSLQAADPRLALVPVNGIELLTFALRMREK